MELVNTPERFNNQDIIFIEALKSGNSAICNRFFYKEIGNLLQKIRIEVFHGRIDSDEIVNELYLYLSCNNWSKLDGFDGKNGCRLRTWMIPVAWRYFISIRERLLNTKDITENADLIRYDVCDDLRIQIRIDVNYVLSKMPNQRYVEIIRLLFIEGYSAKDVAHMFEIKVENVYNLKHRAIAQFVELYGQR